MLCEDCNQNQATVMITVTAGGDVTTRHLCQDCMKKMETSFTQGDVQSFLSSLLGLLSSQSKASQMTCPSCGQTYEDFQRTGKLGCAQCYHAFEEELRPLLARIHGRSQHAGHTPAGQEVQTQLQTAIDGLRARMEKAVLVEDFEEAAKLRDEIRALAERPEKENQP